MGLVSCISTVPSLVSLVQSPSTTDPLYFSRHSSTINRSTRRRIVHRFSAMLGKKVKTQTIIPGPDYRIPIVLLGTSGGFLYADNLAAAAPIGLLGLLLLFQS